MAGCIFDSPSSPSPVSSSAITPESSDDSRSSSYNSSSVSSSESSNESSDYSSESFTCSIPSASNKSYLTQLGCADDFMQLQGLPLTKLFGGVQSVKVLYDIAEERIYFVDTDAYRLHYYFCSEVLGYTEGHAEFNDTQYSDSDDRLWYLGVVNHYTDLDIYTLEVSSRDEISAEGIIAFYTTIADSSYFSESFFFMPVSNYLQRHNDLLAQEIPLMNRDSIYKGQIYQPLHLAPTYGYLRKMDVDSAEDTYHNTHDIILTNGVPNDISVVSGIITTEFQTPLSHINVLSQNRNTPNMAFKNAWSDTSLQSLIDELVYFEVRSDSFIIHKASLLDAERFWNDQKPSTEIIIESNDSADGLFDMEDLDHYSTPIVGAKAANFSELTRLYTRDVGVIPTPEASFAIPFHYYQQHLTQNDLDRTITEILNRDDFKESIVVREAVLKELRDMIREAPIDSSFLQLVSDKIESFGTHRRMRFRSSTNAEDLPGFNGAGLYTSKTGDLDDPEKPIDSAIKKVWASNWNLRAYEEREYFGIDHRSVRMGLLVHRSFPDELANGVAITTNLYNSGLPALTINVQLGEESVVAPEPSITTEQFIYYTYTPHAFSEPVIDYVTHSSLTDGEPVLSEPETLLLAKHLSTINDYFYEIYNANESLSYRTFAMDVEFKIDGVNRDLYIKQARPY
ncbi:MAG: PEP/pyruvate-binding domain-containing protein [Fibrobacterales bacterium]